jgi:hypothetical protein
MLTGYIRLVLECIPSVSSCQENGVFPHCLPFFQRNELKLIKTISLSLFLSLSLLSLMAPSLKT